MDNSMFSDHRAFMTTDNNYLGMLTYQLLKSHPNIKEFKMREETRGGTMKLIDEAKLFSLKLPNLKKINLNMSSSKNIVFYQ